MPEDVDELVRDLYRRLPEVRVTDILMEVDVEVDASEEINLGLSWTLYKI